MHTDPTTPEPANTEGPDRYRQLLAEAITVLTAAARLTHPTMERDEHASAAAGRPVWVESGRREPVDWAEFVTLALAGAAANIGSISTVLEGRPGSWEASGVGDLLVSTVGHDGSDLLRHRTEPVVVELYVEEILTDLGFWTSYDQPSGRSPAAMTPPDSSPGRGDPWGPQPLTPEQERIDEQLDDLYGRLEQQRRQDWEQYGEALKAQVLAAAAARDDLTVPVTVTIDLENYRSEREGDWHDTIENTLRAAAIKATPLPGDGRAPLDRAADIAQEASREHTDASQPSDP